MKVSHILVATEKEAKRILEEIKKEQITFEEGARTFSSCPSKRHGGDLGEFKKGVMAKLFENACYKLKVGEISLPIRTESGWHIIKRTISLPVKTESNWQVVRRTN